MMSPWKLLADEMPEEKKVVLLLWPVPDMKPIVRLGCIMWKPILSDQPIWKFELDCGDAGAWVFTNKDDEQPTYWMPIPAVPAMTNPMEAPQEEIIK